MSGERYTVEDQGASAVSNAFRQCARINREMAGVIGALPGSSIWSALEACAEKMDQIAASPTPEIHSQDHP